MKRMLWSLVCLFFMSVLAGCYGYRTTSPDLDSSKQQALVEKAAATVRFMRSNPRFATLDYFLHNARGVLIFPNLIKAALIYGAEGGSGVLVARDSEGNWSAPAFYTLGGGSFGLQAGAKGISLVLVFMNESTLYGAIETGMTLGVDASVTAGFQGAKAKADTLTAFKDVYYFAEEGGLFIGLSLEGSVITPRSSYNEAFYGAGATPRDIILKGKHAPKTKVLEEALTSRSF